MRLDRLTVKSHEGLASAEALARCRDQQDVTRLHLLQALLDQAGGLVSGILERAGAASPAVRARLDQALGRLPVVRDGEPFIGRDLNYADFEGVIEEGQYGAGPVLVWDTGWFELVGGQAATT
jgi:ATP-dependent Clp protease ATP-binding subunit ClpA